ncbi:uncharacterized protein LOC128868310 [Anastrepha ludens]|uniref:uncharacterized protein LOC128868310 n=1 Tax=Anastrepha ludens TaxID=28586 RepID=UPI0023B0AC1A|nr:uncharacterized protein LOC128868310 [Anastrepha ludens]
MLGYLKLSTFALVLFVLTKKGMCGERSSPTKVVKDSEDDGSYTADLSGSYVADNVGQYVEDNKGVYHHTGDEGRWLPDDMGVYHDDLKWRYIADNIGAWVPDNSGNYDPAQDALGAYHRDDSGVYHADNTGAYSEVYEKVH